MDTGPARPRELKAEVAALRRHYLASLPARREALVHAWSACVAGGDEAAWQQLRQVAHKLSGSALCYGYGALGEAARALDTLLGGRVPCRQRSRAQRLVEQVLAELEALSGGG